MSDEYTIQLDESDTAGHAGRVRFTPEDEDWLRARLSSDGEKVIRLALADEDDTEGHLARTGLVRVIAVDEDDTEGHAISLQFPNVDNANAFRRRILATGAIAGTIILGSLGGAAVAEQMSGGAASQLSATEAWQEASSAEGARQGAATAPMNANQAYQEAAANEGLRQGAAGAASSDLQEAWQEASRNAAAQQGGGSAPAADDEAGGAEQSGLTPR